MFSEKDLLFIAPERNEAVRQAGGFLKKVLVVYREEPQFAGAVPFLEKILGAAKVNLQEDTLHIVLPEQDVLALGVFIREKQPAQVLVFGFSPAQLGIHLHLTPYEPAVLNDSILLFSDALSVLEPDKLLKTKLWNALQQIFK